jgi:Tol biopolymer transport system component
VAERGATARWRFAGALIALALAMLAGAAPVAATFPGPNGRIAFSDYLSGQIYAVNPDGSALVQLTNTGPRKGADAPSWSADGERLLFERFNVDGEGRIWVMRADGSHQRKVAGEANGFSDLTPTYTPDGREIVFTRCHPEPKDVCAIWKMRSDGTHKEALTKFVANTKEERTDFGASVSPDGRWIAFGRFDAGGFAARIFVMTADGRDARAVTKPPLEAFDPDWAPNGKRITFSSKGPRLGSTIFTIRPDGTGLQEVTPSIFPHNNALSTYSPRGNRLAFISDRNYPDLCCNDLMAVDSGGGGEHMIDTGLSDAGILFSSWGTAPLLP